MTDEQIREVLTGTRNYMLSSLPKTEWKHEFSAKFCRKMNKLIQWDKHPTWYLLRKVAAIIFLVASISGGLVLGFNGEVRAEVIRWITERFTHNEWRYRNSSIQSSGIVEYTLEGNVPDGYRLIERIDEADKRSEVYVSEDGVLLYFTVMYSGYDGEFYVVSDEINPKDSAYIGDIKADLYLSEDPGEPNVIVWEGEKGVLFNVQGVLEKEQLIEFPKKIK